MRADFRFRSLGALAVLLAAAGAFIARRGGRRVVGMGARGAYALALVLGLALGALGCGAPPVVAPAERPPLPAPSLGGPLADARPWLAGPADRARQAGAGKLATVGVDAGQEGDRVGSFVTVSAGECLLVLAQGAATVTDADVHVFSDSGDLLASDEARRASAALVVCPPLPSRVYVSARIVAGSGVLAVGAARVPEAAAPAVARAVGARWRGEPTDAERDPWSSLERALEARQAAVGPSWIELRRVLLPVDARARSMMSVPVRADRCIDVLAMPGEAVQAVELTVEASDGRVAERAAPNGRERAATVCAHGSAVATIALRAVGSAGLALVLVRESPPGGWTELDPPLWLDEPRAAQTIAQATTALGMRLRSAWGVPRRVGAASAPVGHALRFPIALEPGCSRIDVVAGAPLVGLVAELWSAEGKRWAARAGRPHAALFHCGDAAPAVVEVSAESRPGPFEVQLRRVGPVPELARRHGLAAARLLGRFEERGVALAAAALGRARLLELAGTERTVLPVAVPANGCVRVAAALLGEPTGLWLRLAGPAGDAEPVRRERLVVDAELCGSGAAAQARIELASEGGAAQALLLAVEAGAP